ncbi:hypothetical protein TorRG33x02_269020 [Trema orientale]|uniref:Plant self-incompatibility S1 n=1 Tax=Trema orientale TaxID=63057 RepID=A0A2P5CYG3_TREOI|nr:hypothetical protein TorRG33x02_269020 [Trema orientale]
MSMSSSVFIIIFFLVLSTYYFKTTLTFSPHEDHNRRLATVHIITTPLPKNNSGPGEVKIRLTNSKQSYYSLETTLKWGNDYQFVAEERALYYGEALWGTYVGSWHAFQPKRDAGHGSVFWLVKPNGFFLSWDNSTWVKKSIWEYE